MKHMKHMKHIILGAGASAISAARRILKENSEDNIVMISQDDKVYSRCMLHKYISGERNEDELNFINDDILQSGRLMWIRGKKIDFLDGKAKKVYEGNREITSGNTILIATGAESIIPPIGQLRSASNVFGLRHLSDARAIIAASANAGKIAVIGAGLVGLDAVYGILEAGQNKNESKKEIHVMEMAPSILAVNLDSHAAGAYQDLFEKKGVKFHLGSRVTDTICREEGKISGLRLDNGLNIECDMIIVAAGVRPATAFLEPSGNSPGSGIELTERRAVKVNEYLETNIPGIYAAGDAAGLSGIWPNAQKQGDIAAYNMTGTRMEYDDIFAMKNTVNFFGLLSVSLGIINPEEGDEVLLREDRKSYRKLILRKGIPAGIVLQGEIGGSGFWQHTIKNKIPLNKPWKQSYASFFGTEANGEYKWVHA